MDTPVLTSEARRENAAALAAAMGLSLQGATEALDVEIAITAHPADPTATRIASEVMHLLQRTISRASNVPMRPSAELVIGKVPAQTDAAKIYVDVTGTSARLSHTIPAHSVCAPTPAIVNLLVACYASGAALQRALQGTLPFAIPDPFVFRFDELGLDFGSLLDPIDVERTYLSGGGAIGNGFLWAAQHLNLRGQLDIADDDVVSSGNLNRQIWFTVDDIDLPKVDRLVERAQPKFRDLVLVPRQSRLQTLPERSDTAWLRRLVVAVDSRRARRALQNEFPCEVFDASTTDIREVVIHHNKQRTTTACLSCIYQPDPDELSREQHIADHLGVMVEDVRRERISHANAATISARFPSLVAADIVGTAYDTLFKRLCAESQLKTAAGRTVVAPFAFVSVLAGTFLALEIVRRLGAGKHRRDFNYWRLSPWHPPFGRRRILRPRQEGCSFCGSPVLRRVNERLWP